MSATPPSNLLRSLPQIEELLCNHALQQHCTTLGRALVTRVTREVVDERRARILAGTNVNLDELKFQALIRDICALLTLKERSSLRSVINATGVIIHTNLGRSVLAQNAVRAMVEVAQGYSTLEYQTATMARGNRQEHCEELLCSLSGAEAAMAVNNNAAAVMMVLSEFAADRQAVVSRGELVEIGGSFRIPDIMKHSHATMVEVGTTNKTHMQDYAQAINQHTSLLLKVHRSNFRLVGFQESVPVKELASLAHEEREKRQAVGLDDELLVYEDQGSGALVHLECFGAYAEPTVAESLQQGADLVSFSGDKLLGGPQAGLIVGSKRHIARLKANPLARVMRLDKMTLAALEATLRLYLNEEEAMRNIPTLRMLSEPTKAVERRATHLLALVQKAVNSDALDLAIVTEVARAGGGALPMCDIPTFALQVSFKRGNAQECERYLVNEHQPAIVARIKHESILFDARTLLNEKEMSVIAQALHQYVERLNA